MSKFSRGHISSAKLKPEQVLELRQRYNQGWTQRRLADEYDMSVVQVGRICRGESWRQYRRDPHPQEIQHSEAIALMGDAPPVELPQETIDKLMKDLAAVPPMPGTPAADPLDEFIKPKGEGS